MKCLQRDPELRIDREILEARVLLVDDEPSALRALRRVLQGVGYGHISQSGDGASARSALEELAFDLVVLDLDLGDTHGFEILREIRGLKGPSRTAAVLVLTGNGEAASRRRAFELGARDFLVKPLDPFEIVARVGNVLENRMLQRHLESRNRELSQRVQERTRDLESMKLDVLRRLAWVANTGTIRPGPTNAAWESWPV
jgi:cyclic di-GMP phosphodiesterase